MDYGRILNEEIGNEIRSIILKEIEDNGYINMNKFVNILDMEYLCYQEIKI